MTFSERQKLEKEYYKWLDKNKNVKPNPLSVISFLDNNNNLITKEEKRNVQILQIAFEQVCLDLLKTIYPNKEFINYTPKITMRRYIKMAEKVLKEEEKEWQRNNQ